MRSIIKTNRFRMEKHDVALSAPPWIVFYNSMIIILTAFFIMYSTSRKNDVKPSISQTQIEEEKHSASDEPTVSGFEEIIMPIRNEDDISRIVKTYGELKSKDIVQMIRLLKSNFQREFGQKKSTVSFYFDTNKHDMVLSLAGKLLFDEGKASLSKKAKKNLKKIVAILKKFPYMTSIQAFSDSTPIKTKRFPSNWELSSERAISVVRYFTEEEGIPEERLVAEGFGVFSSKGGGRSRERKVEIVLMDIIG